MVGSSLARCKDGDIRIPRDDAFADPSLMVVVDESPGVDVVVISRFRRIEGVPPVRAAAAAVFLDLPLRPAFGYHRSVGIGIPAVLSGLVFGYGAVVFPLGMPVVVVAEPEFLDLLVPAALWLIDIVDESIKSFRSVSGFVVVVFPDLVDLPDDLRLEGSLR